MNITVPMIFAIAGVVAVFLALIGKVEIKKFIIKLPAWARIFSGVFGFAFISLAIWLFLQPVSLEIERSQPVSLEIERSQPVSPEKERRTPPMPEVPITSKYSFEDGSMGWIPQDYEDSGACVQVIQSNENAKEGYYSLKMVMELIGGDVHKSKGEAWVNMRDNPPSGEAIPLDLTNRTITAWVYATPGSRGDRSKPNGFQLFVKDENWNSEYGPWKNVVEGQWIQISLAVSTSKPQNGHVDQGFDPSRIIAIGVKMGSGGGSTTKFEGIVYIDAID